MDLSNQTSIWSNTEDNPALIQPESYSSPSNASGTGLYYQPSSSGYPSSSPIDHTVSLYGDFYLKLKTEENMGSTPITYQHISAVSLMGSYNSPTTLTLKKYDPTDPSAPPPPTGTPQEGNPTFYFDSPLKAIEVQGFSLQNIAFHLENVNFNFQPLEGKRRVYGITLINNAQFNIRQAEIHFDSISGNSEVYGLQINNYNASALELSSLSLQSSSIVFNQIRGNRIFGFYTAEKVTLSLDQNSEITFKNLNATDYTYALSPFSPLKVQGGGTISFSSVNSQNNAIGLQTSSSLLFEDQSQITFGIIQASNATGILSSLPNEISGNGKLHFKNIEGSNFAYGILGSSSLQSNSYAFGQDLSLSFDSITSPISAYGVYNSGDALYDFGSTITFKSISSDLKAIGFSHQGGLAIIQGKLHFESISGTKALGIQNKGEMIFGENASFVFGVPKEKTQDTQTIGISDHLGTTFDLGNLTLQTSGEDVIGISAGQNSIMLLGADKTLQFDIKNISSAPNKANLKEAIAFQGGNLILSSNSKVIFNSNGGMLHTLSGNDAWVFLSGNRARSSQQESTQSLKLRSLTINNLNAQNTSFVLYGNNSATIDHTNGYDGRSYASNTTHAQTGGSDRLIIQGTHLIHPTNNTLLLSTNTLTGWDSNHTILAEVAIRAKDTLIFNHLKKDKDHTKIRIFSGFETTTADLQRHDTLDKTYYVVGAITEGGDSIGNGGNGIYIEGEEKAIINEEYLPSTLSAIQSNFYLLSANLNSLNKRMGDLRYNSHAHGIWARFFYGSQNIAFGTDSKNTYYTIQAGYDHGFELKDSTNYLGFALSYTHSNNKQSSSYIAQQIQGTDTTNTDGIELALYNSFISQDFYSDSILKASYLTSGVDYVGGGTQEKIQNYALSLSQEFGYVASLGENKEWKITPQVEVAYSYLSAFDTTRTHIGGDSLHISQNSLFILRSRAGFDWRYDFSHLSKNTKANLYIGTYYVFDAFLGGDVTLKTNNGTQMQLNTFKSDDRLVLNVGTNVNFLDCVSLYFDFEKSFLGEHIQTNYQVNFGARYNFGESRTKTPQTPTQNAPLKLQEN